MYNNDGRQTSIRKANLILRFTRVNKKTKFLVSSTQRENYFVNMLRKSLNYIIFLHLFYVIFLTCKLVNVIPVIVSVVFLPTFRAFTTLFPPFVVPMDSV